MNVTIDTFKPFKPCPEGIEQFKKDFPNGLAADRERHYAV